MFRWGGRISELAWLIDKLSVVFADMQSHQCTHCRKQFAHRGNLMRHLALHDPNNAEYQAALRRDDAASTGDEADYEAGDDEGTTFLELHNAVAAASDAGVQLTELDGDQMQVFCVLRFIKVKLFSVIMRMCNPAWKGRPRNDLYCVRRDVKPYSFNRSL